MKKRVLALLVCSMVSVNLLAGCGSEEAEAPAQAEVVVEEVAVETGDMCSDADFAALQDAYAAIVDEYNAVVDYYQTNDDIAQDDDMEALLAQAKEYVDTVGEISQDGLTTADAEQLAGSMVDVAEGLAQAAEALGIMAANGAAASASEGDVCSDASFAALQEAYSYLTEEYNTIVDEYQNNDAVAQNDELESYLADAKALIEEIGAVEQETITEADAVSIAESMNTLATSLADVAAAVFN